jgi:hypothetical protein
VSDSSVSIKDGDRFATLNGPKKLAQSGLEFGNANLLHD